MSQAEYYFSLLPVFLQSIQEVGGYVLIAMNEAANIPLVNLRLIRGQNLKEGRYALLVMSNYNRNPSSATLDYTGGLRQLQLSSLTGTHTDADADARSRLAVRQGSGTWERRHLG